MVDDKWFEYLRVKGHSPVYDEHGNYHSGARCKICGDFYCQMCDPDPDDIQPCISALSEDDLSKKIEDALKQSVELTKLIQELYMDSKKKAQK